MSFTFRPAETFTGRHGLFVALVGGTNSGKTYSALRLARGIAGPAGKIAVLDTEGGRTLHLREQFKFDVNVMDPPFRPARFMEAAKAAEDAGYAALVIDSFTMEWRGVGGVLEWTDQNAEQMSGGNAAKRDKVIHAARREPKMAHKLMVFALLQRRIPIIFAIRGEDTFDPSTNKKVFKMQFEQGFPFEVTVSFRLASDRKGVIDLSDSKAWKMEGAHRDIFHDGEQLSEAHGERLAEWASGAAPTAPAGAPTTFDSWPRFDKAKDFVAWSKRFLADATPDKAVGWEAQYRAGMARMRNNANAADDVAALLELYGAAIARGGDPGDFGDDDTAEPPPAPEEPPPADEPTQQAA